MNIAILAHKLSRGDGQGRINLEMARHLLQRGHALTLISEKVDRELVDAGAKWIRIAAAIERPRLLSGIALFRKGDRVLDQHKGQFDVVIGNGATLSRPHQLNLCQFVHGAWLRSPVHVSRKARWPLNWYQTLYTRSNARLERISYGASKFVVAPSQRIRQELLSIGVPDSKIRVIYNGVDLQEFQPGQESRAELGLPPEGPLALFVGDIRSSRKNLDSVIKALPRVPNLRLAVAGRVAGSPFPALAQQLGVADRVTFLDFRRDIGKLMRAADFFVFPSRYEAGTLVLIEALASGLPVVTARTAGGCEIMEGRAGHIIDDPDDIAALAEAMTKMTALDSAARAAVSGAARDVALQYSWTHMAEKYAELVEESVR